MNITGVRPHPTNPKYEIIFIRAQCVAPKGTLKIGDRVIVAQVESDVEGVHCDGIVASKEGT